MKIIYTAPTWNGDLKFSKWGPNGDLILSEMGTFGSRNGDQIGTKWGPKKRIFDKLTETCQFIKILLEKIFTECVII